MIKNHETTFAQVNLQWIINLRIMNKKELLHSWKPIGLIDLLDVDFRSLDMSDYVINKDQPRPIYKLIAVSVSTACLYTS